jgi:hypothetical protein
MQIALRRGGCRFIVTKIAKDATGYDELVNAAWGTFRLPRRQRRPRAKEGDEKVDMSSET